MKYLNLFTVISTLLLIASSKSTTQTDAKDFQNKVAITMDDLPIVGSGRFPFDQQKLIFDKLLTKLTKTNAPVVGFVNGNKLLIDGKIDERKISFLKEWLQKGFDLGNHTFSHKSAHKVSLEEYEKDVLDDDNLLRPIIESQGKYIKYFRHPFLNTGLTLEIKNAIVKYLKDLGYDIAPVTIDNSEWLFAAAYEKAFSKDSIEQMRQIGKAYVDYMNSKFEWYEKKSNELFGRDINQILLIHANMLNSDYFDSLCEMIKKRGYKFISLEEALKDDAYKSKDTFIKNNGISWMDRWALTAGKTKEYFIGEPTTPKFIMEIAEIYSE